jgi:hypothetical protein
LPLCRDPSAAATVTTTAAKPSNTTTTAAQPATTTAATPAPPALKYTKAYSSFYSGLTWTPEAKTCKQLIGEEEPLAAAVRLAGVMRPGSLHLPPPAAVAVPAAWRAVALAAAGC